MCVYGAKLAKYFNHSDILIYRNKKIMLKTLLLVAFTEFILQFYTVLSK
jgi:hypothetical protein